MDTAATAVRPVRPAGDASLDAPLVILYVPGSGRERSVVRDRLARMSLPVHFAATLADAVQFVGTGRVSLCLVDLVDDRGALPSIRMLRGQFPRVPVAAIVDPAHPTLAGDAIHLGVIDLLPWPFEELDVAVLAANARDRVMREAADATATVVAGSDLLFASSPPMRQTVEQVRAAARLRGGVCISGEPGSGRGLIARVLHSLSPRAAGPFVEVDCGATSPGELESQLFGSVGERKERAASPGTERLGKESALVHARGGTMVLLNLIEAPARVQARLARLFRDGEAWAADRRAVVDLDVRPVAVLESSMESSLADGHLRADLFDRLSQHRIEVPPLRRRREDIPPMAAQFLRAVSGTNGSAKAFSRAAMAVMAVLPWAGNARELRGLVETLARSVNRPVIQLEDLLAHATFEGLAARVDAGLTLKDAKARFERDCISAVLVKHRGRVGEAAKALGIQRTNLYRKVRQLNVARSLLAARK